MYYISKRLYSLRDGWSEWSTLSDALSTDRSDVLTVVEDRLNVLEASNNKGYQYCIKEFKR